MKVSFVDKLGDVISIKPNEVIIRLHEYNQLPEELRKDFEVVCWRAKTQYDVLVAQDREKGIRPTVATHKSFVMNEIVRPFLKANKVNLLSKSKSSKGEVKKSSTKVVKTPSKSSKSGSSEQNGSTGAVEQEITEEVRAKISKLYSNFDSEELSDEYVKVENKSLIDTVAGATVSVNFEDDLSSAFDDVVIIPQGVNINTTGISDEDLEDIANSGNNFFND